MDNFNSKPASGSFTSIQIDYDIRSDQSFRYSGKGIYGFFTDKQGRAASGSDKNLPAVLRPESIFPINLVCPKPYTIIAPETKRPTRPKDA